MNGKLRRGGGVRFVVTSSNRSRRSLQAPAKLTANGDGLALNPSASGGLGAFGAVQRAP
jgi:hypothetical protein